MKKLFMNDKFFGAVTVLAITCTAIYSAVYLVATPEMLTYTVADLVQLVCVAALFVSFKNHSKNAMKGVMGALLMQMFMRSLFTVNDLFGNVSKIMMIILLIITAALLMNHFVINSNRKASPSAIRINQMLCVLLALDMIVNMVYFMTIADTFALKLGNAVSAVASVCVAATIVCVESRLDAYRLDREAAGWTEEAGYPEGYVHEYEKNK